MGFGQDQRSRSSAGCLLTKINSQDLVLDGYDHDQRSRSTFGCVLAKINGLDLVLDVFWPRSTVKI